MSTTLDRIRQAMKDNGVRVPTKMCVVRKDECAFCLDSQFSEQGLLVNLSTWTSVAPPFLKLDRQRTGAELYLLQMWAKVKKGKSHL